MANRRSGMKRRISVTLPEKLVLRMEQYAAKEEYSAFVEEALVDYLDFLDDETEREERSEVRRERIGAFWSRIRESSRKAAEAILPD